MFNEMEEMEGLECYVILALFPIYQKQCHHFSLRNIVEASTRATDPLFLLGREGKKKFRQCIIRSLNQSCRFEEQKNIKDIIGA